MTCQLRKAPLIFPQTVVVAGLELLFITIFYTSSSGGPGFPAPSTLSIASPNVNRTRARRLNRRAKLPRPLQMTMITSLSPTGENQQSPPLDSARRPVVRQAVQVARGGKGGELLIRGVRRRVMNT
ncbi:hypothetical protein E2C01_066688 [Portunus trituberculatus]|uniref:Uncharacterized protein n=1 Tax=Portunus trituberculatus TaxID=210409 RepID=A0A5B7HVC5_PORTR|nr:hypothetical protein [Portunus trituberculatus]